METPDNEFFTQEQPKERQVRTTIRPELDRDLDSVRAVHIAAFPSYLESKLVDALRESGKAKISLVAEQGGNVVGHILFSPVFTECGSAPGLGLGPVAVLPAVQGRGMGSKLIQAGLAGAKDAGYAFVVVLGEPDYYARFGFGKASQFGLGNDYGVDDPFMVIELTPNALGAVRGLVKYEPEFERLET